jgi:DnaJ-class molecular chaperone
MIPDYYTLLGVPDRANTAEIKRAYRRLARLHHPDLNAQAQEAQMRRLNEAYEILSHSSRRAVYDQQRQQEKLQAEAARQQREALLRQQVQAQREPEMTWVQGMFGFIRELKKGMRDD